ncbi:hypothetical protein TNCV_2111441 [Trichonephila clavipes]|nr:hypothetical protein TNCV_2111441 [Trichonephila clavipes]
MRDLASQIFNSHGTAVRHDELLISKVLENNAIYDASDRNHSNCNFILHIWRKIGEEPSMPGEQLKEKWYQLR